MNFKLKQLLKKSILPQIIISTLIAAAITAGIVSAATTIGNNISTGGTLSVTGTSTFTGLTTFGNASTTQISAAQIFASSNIYTALTANSIPYIGTSGLLTQDTSNFVWDSTNNRLGIGTTSPYARLSVVGETVASNFTATSTTATTTLAGGLNVGSGGLVYDRSTGNVGIGTDSPAYALDVVGIIQATVGAANRTIAFTTPSAATGITAYSQASNIRSDISFLSTGIAFDPGNNGNSIFFDTSGGVGIGTSTPSSKLAVSGGVSIGANYDVAAPTNGLIVEGNVGIGTTSPATPLDVSTTATTTITIDSSATTQGACLKLKKATTTGYIYCIATEQGTLSCSTTSCE